MLKPGKQYLLDDGMLALLRWMEKERHCLRQIYANGEIDLKNGKIYDELQISQRNDGDQYLVTKIKKDGWDLSRLGISIPVGMMPQSILHRIMSQNVYPAQKVINHPYLRGAVITAIHADTITSGEVLMMIKRKKPRFILTSNGIEPRFND